VEQKLKFSVAMSVYKNDSPDQLRLALDSICEQSYPADEIYLVVDGPIGAPLDEVIEYYSTKYGNFTVNRLAENGGLGNALRIAVEKCRNDLIIRMDSDDISAPGRFEKQINA
jgi:glycosyltransferase involved in cell wall biosynthesis